MRVVFIFVPQVNNQKNQKNGLSDCRVLRYNGDGWLHYGIA